MGIGRIRHRGDCLVWDKERPEPTFEQGGRSVPGRHSLPGPGLPRSIGNKSPHRGTAEDRFWDAVNRNLGGVG
jgi:hypothetical protein